MSRLFLPFATTLAVVVAIGTPRSIAAQVQTGNIEGTITDAGTGRTLAGAQVFVAGTQLGSPTNESGVYRIAGVPARQVEIRVRLIGYAPAIRTLVVTAGQTERADIKLQVSALQLEQVVVTGSGQQTEVKRLGNTVAVIQAPENAPINDLSNLLQAREPGLTAITPSGLTGEGARIRIRGNASLTQSNEPVFFIDGVRMNAGGAMTSRLDDIDPNTIERVEVLKGAAAATLYGTEASNGVVQIFTKKGSSRAPRWNVQMEQEAITFPDRVKPNAGYARSQARADSLAQFWAKPGLKAYEVFTVPIFKDFLTETGNASTVAASVNGGASSLTYFASGRFQREDGAIGGENLGPGKDDLRRIQTGLNLSLVPTNSIHLGLRNSYFNVESNRPGDIIGNSIYGAFALSQYARPEVANCNKSTYVAPGECSGPGNPFGAGAAFMTMREAMQQLTSERVSRYNGAINGTWTPMSEVNVDLTGGYDIINRRNLSFSRYRYDVDEFTTNNIEGSRSIGTSQNRLLTLDSKVAWNRPISSTISSALVAGMQVFNDRSETSGGSSIALPGPGIVVVGAGGQNIAATESFQTDINGGYFAQEQLGFRNLAFLTLGGRYDFASAFGESSPGVFYPKLSLSVVPSDMSRWSQPFGINTFRVRFAVGQSGRQPGSFDKFTTFAPLRAEAGAGLAPSQLGNQDLKPEIATEFEGGFEMGLHGDRIGLNATAWHREVKDLLIDQQFATSGGFRRTQIANIGNMNGYGYEFGARAFAISRPSFGMELFANAAYLSQKITSLGNGVTQIKVDPGYIRHLVYLKVGDPLGSLYVPRLASACPNGGTTPANNSAGKPIACYGPGQSPISLNGNGRAATDAELLAYLAQPRDLRTGPVQSALQPLLADYDGNGKLAEQRIGDIIPDWTGSFGTNLTFSKNWRVMGLMEYRTGYQIANLTDAFRSSQHATIGSNTQEYEVVEAALGNPASTPEQRLAAAKEYISKYRRLLEPGLNEVQDGSFLRLREVALTYNAPATMASKVGFGSMSITAAGRNLLLFTKYGGADPELSYAGRQPGGGTLANFRDASEAFGLPVPRRFSLMVNLGF